MGHHLLLPRQEPFWLKSLHVNLPSYDRVSRFEPVAGERRVPELRGGARGVSDFGEPGPGGSHGRVRIVVDAHDWSGVRGRDSAGSFGADADVCEFGDAGGAVCSADDWAHSRVATFY